MATKDDDELKKIYDDNDNNTIQRGVLLTTSSNNNSYSSAPTSPTESTICKKDREKLSYLFTIWRMEDDWNNGKNNKVQNL